MTHIPYLRILVLLALPCIVCIVIFKNGVSERFGGARRHERNPSLAAMILGSWTLQKEAPRLQFTRNPMRLTVKGAGKAIMEVLAGGLPFLV